jgi:hypothetical protein
MRPDRVTMLRVGSASSRHQITSVTSPKVQIMAMPEPFSGSARGWARIGHLDPEERGVHGACRSGRRSARRRDGPPAPRRRPPARVGSSRSRCRRSAGGGRRRPLAVLHLGLGHRGLVVHVPQGGRLGRVGLAATDCAGTCADWPAGCGRRWWRTSGSSPPTAQPAPQVLEGPLVLGRQLVAQGDEVGPADRDVVLAGLISAAEVRVVGQRGVAAHTEVGLHPPLGGQARCRPIPSGRRAPPAHAPVAGHGVGLHVAEDRAHVQRARHRRGRGVDGEDLAPGAPVVEAVGPLVLPRAADQRGLDPVEGGFVGDAGRAPVASVDMIGLPYPDAAPPRHRDGHRPPLRAAHAGPRCRCTCAAHGLRPAAHRPRPLQPDFDVLRRYLLFNGLAVHYVSNITDVDDNIITRAARRGGASQRWPRSTRRAGGRPWTPWASCGPPTSRTPRPTWTTWSAW